MPMQQSSFTVMPATVPSIHAYQGYSPDLRNPGILSTTNWLETTPVVNRGSFTFPDLEINNGFAQLHSLQRRSTLDGNKALAERVDINNVGLYGQQVNKASPTDQRANTCYTHPHAGSPVGLASVISTISPDSMNDGGDDGRESGQYYVDGESARLPRVKRRKFSVRQAPPPPSWRSTTYNLRNPGPVPLEHRIEIKPEAYAEWLHHYHVYALQPPDPLTAFEPTDFPPIELFEHMLWLYFRSFSQIMPFVNQAVIIPASSTSAAILSPFAWLLLLSMSALGSHYLENQADTQLSISLHEFVQRILASHLNDASHSHKSDLVLAQVQILHAVGLAYCGDERLVERGLDMQVIFRKTHALMADTVRTLAISASTPRSMSWLPWVQLESYIRTAYCAWLLDSMWCYHFGMKPTLTLGDGWLPLPCNEKLWNATTEYEWRALWESTSHVPTPSLVEAIHNLYVDKQFLRDTGEFARILVVHGLYHRSWEVERYLSDPLSQWEPTAQKQNSVDVLPSTPVWLPSLSTFTRWQNSACDCLDILHWQADATIGLASGLEHPTVLHLHTARVILLSPFQHIVSLAKAMTHHSDSNLKAQIFDDSQVIRRWTLQCQYKARLACIHAGVLFWHVRRHSIDGFYEPTAVALATLMLWAFGRFVLPEAQARLASARLHARQEAAAATVQSSQIADDASDEVGCEIILLDRPTDDELVQQFIRTGYTMQAHMTGVGDLYGPRGSERVLLEGCKLLRSLQCWGVARSWLTLLQSLLDTCTKEGRPVYA